ncbi:phosphoenolpyruvate--protein phosphotransferase [Butyricicoccus sp. AF22-28AC]|jgi:phosphoenolpyruvate-protein phosphotransferase (PTS system enzyme I)|nr:MULTISPECIES: phosphoenolpyruvate--protein phosphotransferase [unclassified Butyricicoccus]RGM79117.1 phosphoenolpyruvate--protein phosphotransferase [Butyricicoccus sp. OM06-6AC]RHQ70565.1 phosphoenolpyruvate--protein phosphotransferase [Butyricicoccus sp. AF24-19AC]RHQ80231.1 phosphoenolpyruvate--protein phosphotransferase [Butyricicoccus sp. AF22-28AC]RHR85575.1 phosphoenolpyruvate--protein phosphotransferase [Butyricicoccus sp. AF15-40]
MEQIFGKGVSKGVAAGPISFYRRASGVIPRHEVSDTAAELERFRAARETAKEQLAKLYDKALAEAGEDAAMLFEAHQMMLDDLDFVESIEGMIENDRVNAEAAVSDTGAQFAEMFAAMDDSYMQARAADIRDISARVIGILTGEGESGIVSDVPCIVAADDLAPSETVQLDKALILGFITAGGSANSHTAILARTMGIPAIISAGDALQPEMEGKYAIIDGQTGEAVVEPDDAERERLLKRQAKEKALKELLDQLKGKPNVTKDGRNVMVYCNIGSPADIDAVLQNDGGGIGLFRSEFLYLQGSDYPTEDEQFEAYKTVAERMGGKRVIIRTLDIGADKQADYFHLDKEENPAMGLRAIRICLTRPEVFRTQLRALYRASAYGKIAIMFPMITSVWEVQEIKRICRNIRAELAEEGVPMADKVELGIMIETPAAVMMSAELAHEVDFFSVGTNDLTQYTLAVDRQGVGLDRFFDAHHPAVLRMIRMAAENAHKAGIWIGICGELGADAELTETFLSMGIDELSVSPSAVLPLRSAIRSIDTTTLAPLEL